MPLIILLLLLLIAVWALDNRIIFRILYAVINLWLLVMFFVTAEIQTAGLPQVPWFDPAGISTTMIVYLALLMVVSGVLLFLLSRQLRISRVLRILPFVGALLLAADLTPFYDGVAIRIAGSAAALLLMFLQIFLFAVNINKSFKN